MSSRIDRNSLIAKIRTAREQDLRVYSTSDALPDSKEITQKLLSKDLKSGSWVVIILKR